MNTHLMTEEGFKPWENQTHIVQTQRPNSKPTVTSQERRCLGRASDAHAAWPLILKYVTYYTYSKEKRIPVPSFYISTYHVNIN